MQTLNRSSNIENRKQMIISLRSTIQNARNKKILKRRSCHYSKI